LDSGGDVEQREDGGSSCIDSRRDAQGGCDYVITAAGAAAAAASEQDIDPLNISMACMLWAASIPNCGVMYDV
jgi:hypothetical protein